jgi:small-conductance mechanosensitive channel
MPELAEVQAGGHRMAATPKASAAAWRWQAPMDAITVTGLTRWLAVVGVVLAVLLTYVIVWRVILRVVRDRTLADELWRCCKWPSRAVAVLLAIFLALRAAQATPTARGAGIQVLTLALVLASAWLAVRLVRVAERTAVLHYDIDVPDNLRARRLRTQVRVLGRAILVAIVVLTFAVLLLTFPQGRTVGATLLASAGIAGVLAGVAARSTLGNLIAGLQIAFAEPIRLDDVVVVEREWGHVEEITLTFVVIRLWDRRRLVLPTSYLVDHPIQNWTKYSADIVGSVHLYVDYATPVDDLRLEFSRILAGSELWDGQVSVLQVIDATERTMVLRALVSASSAPRAWDLSCDVREQLLTWLRHRYPGSLPRLRAEVRAPASNRPGVGDGPPG